MYFQLLLLAGAFALAKLTNVILGHHLADFTSITPEAATPIALVLGWFIYYLCLRLLTAGLLDGWKKSRPDSGGADRMVGGLLGLIKVFTLVYMTCVFLFLSEQLIDQKVPIVMEQLRSSQVGAFVEQNNIMDKTDNQKMRAVGKLIRLSTDPGLRERVKEDPEIQDKIKSIYEMIAEKKPELAEQLKDGKASALSKTNDLMELMENPEFLDLLNSLGE